MTIGFDRPTLGTKPGAQNLLGKLTRFFDQNQWSYEPMVGQPALVTAFRGSSGNWNCVAAVNETAQQVAFFAIVDTKVAPEYRPAVIDFLTRANYGLGLGNFEMDLSDGEVRCKTCASVAGTQLSQVLIQTLVQCSCELMDQYVPALRKVAAGELAPEAALEQAERPSA